MKRLNELYKGESNHKSLWSRAKEGLERVKARHDAGFKKLQMKQEFEPPPPQEPNLGQKDAKKDKEPNFSVGKAVAGAVVGGLVTGSPIGAASLGFLWGTQKKKKK